MYMSLTMSPPLAVVDDVGGIDDCFSDLFFELLRTEVDETKLVGLHKAAELLARCQIT